MSPNDCLRNYFLGDIIQLTINPEALFDASHRLYQTRVILEARSHDTTAMGAGLSSIPGVTEAGVIHGRLLHTDPASAQVAISKLAEHVGWMGTMFNNVRAIAGVQDMHTSIGLDHSSLGFGPTSELLELEPEPATDYQPLSFAPPVVMLGASFPSAVNAILGIDTGAIASATARWTNLVHTANELVMALSRTATQIEDSNRGDAIESGLAKIRAAISSAEHFAANATAMAAKTGALEAGTISTQLTASAMSAAINAVPDPATRLSLEQAALGMLGTGLQTAIDASLPSPGSLMQPGTAAGGGSLEAGLSGSAGLGKEYSTAGVAWPQPLIDAAARGAIGPDSFGFAHGRLEPADGLQLNPAELEGLRNAAQAPLNHLFDRAGISPQLGGIDTVAANAGVTAGGATPTIQQGPNLSLGANGLGVAGAGTHVAGTNSAGFGALAAQGGIASSGPVSGGFAGAGHNAGAATRTGVGGTALGGGGLAGGGPAAGPSAGAGGKQGLAGGPRVGDGAAAGRLPQGAAAGAGSGAGPAGTGAGRMMPSMIAPGQKASGGRGTVKSVTSAIEADPNRRALLHPLPPAIPGVIGAWVRE